MATAIEYGAVAVLIAVGVVGGITHANRTETMCSSDFGTATMKGHRLELTKPDGSMAFQTGGIETEAGVQALSSTFCTMGNTQSGQMVKEYRGKAFNGDKRYDCTSSNGMTAVADQTKAGTVLSMTGKKNMTMTNFEDAEIAARAFCMAPA